MKNIFPILILLSCLSVGCSENSVSYSYDANYAIQIQRAARLVDQFFTDIEFALERNEPIFDYRRAHKDISVELRNLEWKTLLYTDDDLRKQQLKNLVIDWETVLNILESSEDTITEIKKSYIKNVGLSLYRDHMKEALVKLGKFEDELRIANEDSDKTDTLIYTLIVAWGVIVLSIL